MPALLGTLVIEKHTHIMQHKKFPNFLGSKHPEALIRFISFV